MRLLDGVIHLVDHCRIEDAETLVRSLQVNPGIAVDLAGALSLHTAVVQALLAFSPTITGEAGDAFINAWLRPAFTPGIRGADKVLPGARQTGIEPLSEQI